MTECPDGLKCSSTIPNHYRRYKHSRLAQNRALNSTESSILTPDNTSCLLEPSTFMNDFSTNSKESSVDSAVNLSSASSQSESTPPERPNALMLLRSPGLEDIKKKKGWSPASKASRSLSSSQEAPVGILTPVRRENVVQTRENKNDDEFISYSPLTELPDLTSQENDKDENDSIILFNDFGSDDELLVDVLDQYNTEKTMNQDDLVFNESLHTNDQLDFIQSTLDPKTSGSVGCGPDANHQLTSSLFRLSKDRCSETDVKDESHLSSPQSLVLERLRECLSNPEPSTSFTRPGSELPTKNQNSLLLTKPKVRASGLKQTDIGVFFGLKPLKEKPDAEEKTSELQLNLVTVGETVKRHNRRGKGSTDVSVVDLRTQEIIEGAVQPTATEGDRDMKTQKRKMWNKGRRTDGASGPRQCPFYKKIPG